VTDDVRRALDDYDRMGDVYANDADTDPFKVSYDRPAILAMAGDVRGKRVLDAGCAAGSLTELLVERQAVVVGVDVNPRLVERAREGLAGRAELVVADISTPMPFLESSSFDIVVASLVPPLLRGLATDSARIRANPSARWQPPRLDPPPDAGHFDH
jgi:SAM-dependent methyltransferase